MNLQQIEKGLHSLSTNELKLLKKQITYLIKVNLKIEAPLNEDPDVEKELLYEFFLKQFPSEIPPNYGIFKKHGKSLRTLYNEMFFYIKNLITFLHLPGTRTVFLKMSYFMIEVITNDLRKSPLPCCMKVLLNTRRWELFQSLLEKDFPGYLNSGLMFKILQIEKE